MLCVEGRSVGRSQWEKQAASRQQWYLFCGLLHAKFSLSPMGFNIDNEHFQNISNARAFLSLTVMIMIYDQKYENGSGGRQN